ncbi:hypothetical protein QS306_04550 [Paraburkholderia bonniea]|uniref:hypothetical protein n=1 Tax=Paraburkholderia bonniea TaxID=2152891 RepID=UPI0025745B49|nr:hypothetical protein [Paraburkholderia bonniea]WJF90937.1 hypothetical protein QS306_04550 [Paraburkholderia bonniea]WJF94251.1 hypothetical protein QS308_04555 [Paraburkholderia bonniea]
MGTSIETAGVSPKCEPPQSENFVQDKNGASHIGEKKAHQVKGSEYSVAPKQPIEQLGVSFSGKSVTQGEPGSTSARAGGKGLSTLVTTRGGPDSGETPKSSKIAGGTANKISTPDGVSAVVSHSVSLEKKKANDFIAGVNYRNKFTLAKPSKQNTQNYIDLVNKNNLEFVDKENNISDIPEVLLKKTNVSSEKASEKTSEAIVPATVGAGDMLTSVAEFKKSIEGIAAKGRAVGQAAVLVQKIDTLVEELGAGNQKTIGGKILHFFRGKRKNEAQIRFADFEKQAGAIFDEAKKYLNAESPVAKASGMLAKIDKMVLGLNWSNSDVELADLEKEATAIYNEIQRCFDFIKSIKDDSVDSIEKPRGVWSTIIDRAANLHKTINTQAGETESVTETRKRGTLIKVAYWAGTGLLSAILGAIGVSIPILGVIFALTGIVTITIFYAEGAIKKERNALLAMGKGAKRTKSIVVSARSMKLDIDAAEKKSALKALERMRQQLKSRIEAEKVTNLQNGLTRTTETTSNLLNTLNERGMIPGSPVLTAMNAYKEVTKDNTPPINSNTRGRAMSTPESPRNAVDSEGKISEVPNSPQFLKHSGTRGFKTPTPISLN